MVETSPSKLAALEERKHQGDPYHQIDLLVQLVKRNKTPFSTQVFIYVTTRLSAISEN